MNWAILFIAGIFEIIWTIGLKYTEGFTRLWPSVGTIFAMAASLFLLGVAVRTLPVGTAYAVWVGIGTVGAATFGILILGEPVSTGRVFSIALILTGVIGLKVTSSV